MVPCFVSGVDTANAHTWILIQHFPTIKKGFEERGEHVSVAAVMGCGRSHSMSRTREMITLCASVFLTRLVGSGSAKRARV
jgi:hypothetical protein